MVKRFFYCCTLILGSIHVLAQVRSNVTSEANPTIVATGTLLEPRENAFFKNKHNSGRGLSNSPMVHQKRSEKNKIIPLHLIPRDSVKEKSTTFHFQLTTVTQYKPALHASYSGTNSLTTKNERETTLTSTMFWGTRLWKGSEFYINPEIAGGSGISSAKGVAGFTNGEAFRVGDPAPKLYAARLYIKQTFNLGGTEEYIPGGVNQVTTRRKTNYVSITAGKFSIADFFDNNSYSHDPRSQFFNWALMSMGGWDYPANTRGYTWGIILEYGNSNWIVRAASTLVPKEANGNDMDLNIGKANSNTIEFQKPFALGKKKGTLRLLGFFTNAHMGNYKDAIANTPTNPDIVTTRSYGRTKYGLGINVQQELSDNAGLFMRASFNDGTNETWAFTEIDRSACLGILFNGAPWKRAIDQLGIATVFNALSPGHKRYLASGGYGFIIGDGKLNYSPEWITELYYRVNLYTNLYLTPNYQFVLNPAYNSDRGPANVFSLRAHVEF